jgi:hypothetical protein
VQRGAPEVHLIPPQVHKFGRPQAVPVADQNHRRYQCQQQYVRRMNYVIVALVLATLFGLDAYETALAIFIAAF